MTDSNVPLPISFGDDEEKKVDVKRGIQGGTDIMSSFHAQNDFSAPRAVQKQGGTSTINEVNSGTAPQFTFGFKQPLQIITLELDDAPKQKQAAPLIVTVNETETTTQQQAKQDDVPYTNDLRSYAVPNQTPSQVLQGLTAVLVGYSQDMDIKLDEANGLINGVVFVENYYGIKFEINIWAENQQTTRFELTRNAGDALATSRFLGDIKSKFFIDVQQKEEDAAQLSDLPKLNLIQLSVDIGSMDLKGLVRQLTNKELDEFKNEDDQITKEELDDVNEIISNNEQDSVDELQFLHERLKENGAIGKDIVSHEQLVQTIIAEAMQNKDICVVRGCLLILEQLCNDDKIGLSLVKDFQLFSNLAGLLKHEYALIKNYSVRLLARLSKPNLNEWNMDKSNAANIDQLVKAYQAEWKESVLGGNGFLNDEMFNAIYAKLAECQ